jgi:outer membrane biosynthesis protein TonB
MFVPEMRDHAAYLGARMTQGSSAAIVAAFDLVDRRTRAVADYWASAAQSWEPEARLALQLGYFERMADDYAAAVSEAMTPWSEASAPETPPALAGEPQPPAEQEPPVAEPPKPVRAEKQAEPSAAADEGHLGGHDSHELDVRH